MENFLKVSEISGMFLFLVVLAIIAFATTFVIPAILWAKGRGGIALVLFLSYGAGSVYSAFRLYEMYGTVDERDWEMYSFGFKSIGLIAMAIVVAAAFGFFTKPRNV